jgi:hypothetical protein
MEGRVPDDRCTSKCESCDRVQKKHDGSLSKEFAQESRKAFQ